MTHKHPKFRTQYDGKKFEGLSCGPGKTQSHHQEEVDINTIVARFNRTGELPQRNVQPQYLDLLTMPKSLQEAQDRVIAARQNFAELPSAVRLEFRNSPLEFYDRVTRGDKQAIQSLIDNGLAVPQGQKTEKSEQKQKAKEPSPEGEAKSGT